MAVVVTNSCIGDFLAESHDLLYSAPSQPHDCEVKYDVYLDFSTIEEGVCETALVDTAAVALQLLKRSFLVLDSHSPAAVTEFLLNWLDDAMLNANWVIDRMMSNMIQLLKNDN